MGAMFNFYDVRENGNLEREIYTLEESGIDRFRLDIMGEVFIPNFSLEIQNIEAFCRLTNKKTYENSHSRGKEAVA
jgi:pentose-5-phosphate-3-epimerase